MFLRLDTDTHPVCRTVRRDEVMLMQENPKEPIKEDGQGGHIS